MAARKPTPGPRGSGQKRPPALWIALGASAVLLLVAAMFFFARGAGPSKKKPPSVVSVMPVLPPPPPPPPQPTPPPPDPVEPPPDAPEFVEEQAPESPPDPAPAPDEPAPMGSNIQGDGAPDPFGLVGRGGGGMIGGRGKGGGGSQFGWYAGRVQSAVTSALRNHRSTRSAQLTVKARIWVDAGGRVTRASIEGSSGNPVVDKAIEQDILSGLQLPEPPPDGMPMPIVMRISAARP